MLSISNLVPLVRSVKLNPGGSLTTDDVYIYRFAPFYLITEGKLKWSISPKKGYVGPIPSNSIYNYFYNVNGTTGEVFTTNKYYVFYAKNDGFTLTLQDYS